MIHSVKQEVEPSPSEPSSQGPQDEKNKKAKHTEYFSIILFCLLSGTPEEKRNKEKVRGFFFRLW